MSDHWEALPAAALFVVLLLIGGGVIIGTIRRSRNERGALATILDVVPGRLGLRVTGRNDWQVEGKLEELSVRLEHRSHDDWSRVEVMVGDYGQVPMSLFLHKRGSYRESAYQPEQAWRTGDAAFDERVVLYGDRRDVAAAITPRARERLLHVVGELDCWIQNSSVYCEFDDARVDADALVERVPVMGDLIRDLAVPESRHALQAALDDTDVGVRANAVRALGRIGDSHDRELLLSHSSDPSRAVRRALREALTGVAATDGVG